MIFALFLSPLALAAPPACPPNVVTLTNAYSLQIFQPEGPGPAWRDPQACETAPLFGKVADAEAFLEHFPPTASRHDSFDQNILGSSMLDFFRQRISGLYFDPPFGSCEGYTVAYVSDSASHSLHVCPYATNFSTMALAMLMMHEARHIEGHSHKVCTHGDMVGAFACDDTYAEGGSYGVGIEFAVRVARDESMNELVREEARATAVGDFLNRFNLSALGETVGLVLQERGGGIEFFAGTHTEVMLAQVPSTAIVTLRDLPMLFDPTTHTVRLLEAGGRTASADGGLAGEFLALSDSDRSKLVDVLYGDASCLLFRREARCIRGSARASIALPAGVEGRRLMQIGSGENSTLVVVAQDGGRYDLPATSDLSKWAHATIEKDDSPVVSQLIAFVITSDEHRYGLTDDGTVMTYSAAASAWIAEPALVGRKFDRLYGPFAWTQKLDLL